MRADQLLVERGLAVSRAQAQRLIAAGVEFADADGQWRRVAKNGHELAANAGLRLLDEAEARYVSRGGLKLEGALAQTGLDVRGMTCLDVGQSTGGFTDCLLCKGAAKVIGVDVGHGQLHPRLAANPRVIGLEGINARYLKTTELIASQVQWTSDKGHFDSEKSSEPTAVAEFDLVTGDLSFISLTLVLPALAPLVAAGGALLMLVKPQFELQPGQIGKGGIVRDASLLPVVEQRIRAACEALGLAVSGWFDSPIRGADGNREFFVFVRKP
ncbi:MAG: TlyA family RNA methyltransferase [Burkholderiales bacterium]